MCAEVKVQLSVIAWAAGQQGSSPPKRASLGICPPVRIGEGHVVVNCLCRLVIVTEGIRAWSAFEQRWPTRHGVIPVERKRRPRHSGNVGLDIRVFVDVARHERLPCRAGRRNSSMNELIKEIRRYLPRQNGKKIWGDEMRMTQWFWILIENEVVRYLVSCNTNMLLFLCHLLMDGYIWED